MSNPSPPPGTLPAMYGRIVVLDIGSRAIRAGMASQSAAPRLTVPCVVGKARHSAHAGLGAGAGAGGGASNVPRAAGFSGAAGRKTARRPKRRGGNDDSDDEDDEELYDAAAHGDSGGTGDDSPGASRSPPPPMPTDGSVTAQGGDYAFVGLDVARFRAVCDTRHPVDGGQVVDKAGLVAVLRHVFQLLQLNPAQHPVVVTEPLDASKAHRQTLAQIFFSELQVPALWVVPQAVSAVFATGCTSGVAVDCGEHGTRAVAVLDGVGLPATVATAAVGGQAVSNRVEVALRNSGQSAALVHAVDVKESMCFVRDDADGDLAVADPTSRRRASQVTSRAAAATADLTVLSKMEFRLPTGQSVHLACERFEAPEVLFAGAAADAGGQRASVQAAVAAAITACDAPARAFVAARVVTCGGTAMLRGFDQRLADALANDPGLPSAAQSHIAVVSSPVAPADRTWVGAAMLASTPGAWRLFTTAAELSAGGFAALEHHKLMVA